MTRPLVDANYPHLQGIVSTNATGFRIELRCSGCKDVTEMRVCCEHRIAPTWANYVGLHSGCAYLDLLK